MKSTSANYLFPLLLSVGLPIACSGSTDKVAPREQDESGEAGAATNDAGTSSGGSKSNAGGEGGAGDGARAGTGGTGLGGSQTQGGTGTGGDSGGTSTTAGQSAGGDAMGGQGGDSGEVIKTPIDPSLDGADDAASGRYRLHYKGTQTCLVAAEHDLSAAPCSLEANQEFFVDGAGGELVRVRGVATNECVNLAGDALGAVVCAEDAKLELVPVAGGFFQLKLTDTLCIGLEKATPTASKCSADTVWSFDARGANLATNATWSATSTYPGYSLAYAHDGDKHAGLSGHSWTNQWNPPALVLPQEVTIDLGSARQFSVINVYTSQGYEIGSYDIDYWNGAAWTNLLVVEGNTLGLIQHAFPTVVTSKLRFVVRRGPEAQFIYARLNEVEIY